MAAKQWPMPPGQDGNSLYLWAQRFVALFPARFMKLADLGDVNQTAPADGQILKWVAANNDWEPATPAAGLTVAGAQGNLQYNAGAGALGAVAQGTAGQLLQSAGGTAAPSWITPATAGSLLAIQKFTANGTYTPTAGATKALVYCIGPGGGGGGVKDNLGTLGCSASPGGSGGFSLHFISSGLATQTVTVGTGGNGGSNTGGNGSAGSSVTSFGALCIANPGLGGIGQTSDGIASAIPTAAAANTGNIMALGGNTSAIPPLLNVGTGAFFGSSTTSPGFFGGLISASTVVSGVIAGINAQTPGAGGGNAAASASTTGAAGGRGADGLCLVMEYA
jgi:hypothetical protein